MEVWKEKLAPLSWIKCTSPGREGTGLKVPKFPSASVRPQPVPQQEQQRQGAARGSGGGGAARRGQQWHWHCSARAPGVTARAAELAPGAGLTQGLAGPSSERAQAREGRGGAGHRAGHSLPVCCVKCGAPSELVCLSACPECIIPWIRCYCRYSSSS